MSAATILIADDDQGIRTVLSHALGRLGHDVRTTSTAATLWRWVSDGEGDLVITHQRTTGTHAGSLMGIAPTGKPIDVRATNVDQIANGLIIARWSLIDMMSMRTQIDALPPLGT